MDGAAAVTAQRDEFWEDTHDARVCLQHRHGAERSLASASLASGMGAAPPAGAVLGLTSCRHATSAAATSAWAPHPLMGRPLAAASGKQEAGAFDRLL